MQQHRVALRMPPHHRQLLPVRRIGVPQYLLARKIRHLLWRAALQHPLPQIVHTLLSHNVNHFFPIRRETRSTQHPLVRLVILRLLRLQLIHAPHHPVIKLPHIHRQNSFSVRRQRVIALRTNRHCFRCSSFHRQPLELSLLIAILVKNPLPVRAAAWVRLVRSIRQWLLVASIHLHDPRIHRCRPRHSQRPVHNVFPLPANRHLIRNVLRVVSQHHFAAARSHHPYLRSLRQHNSSIRRPIPVPERLPRSQRQRVPLARRIRPRHRNLLAQIFLAGHQGSSIRGNSRRPVIVRVRGQRPHFARGITHHPQRNVQRTGSRLHHRNDHRLPVRHPRGLIKYPVARKRHHFHFSAGHIHFRESAQRFLARLHHRNYDLLSVRRPRQRIAVACQRLLLKNRPLDRPVAFRHQQIPYRRAVLLPQEREMLPIRRKGDRAVHILD